MTIIMIPFLWILFFVNPKWMGVTMSNMKSKSAAPVTQIAKPREWEPLVTEQYLDYLKDLIDEAVRDENFQKEVVNGLDNLISDFRGLRGKYEDLKEFTSELEEKAACADKFLELIKCPGGRWVVAHMPSCPHCDIATAPHSFLSVCDNPQ